MNGLKGHGRGLVLMGWLCLLGGSVGAVDGAMELVWRSGEKLSGKVIRAGAESVFFQPEVETVAGLFPEAAEIRLDRVEEVRMKDEEGTERTEPFWMRLHDGSRLLVDVVGLEGGWLKVKSAVLGEGAEVKLADVASMERARGEGVIFFGAGHEARWTESPRVEAAVAVESGDPFDGEAAVFVPKVLKVKRSRQAKSSEPGQVLRLWQRVTEGGLRTMSWASSLSATLPEAVVKDLPKRMRLDLRLRAEGSPRFAMGLVAHGTELRVETWEDRLVLREGDRFQVVTMPMLAEKKAIGVTVLWDAETHEARLLDESGVEKARLMAGGGGEGKRLMQKAVDPFAVSGNGESKEMSPSVTLENLGADLTVEALNVMGWGGQMPERSTGEGAAFAELMSGRVVRGNWVSVKGGKAVFQGEAGGEAIEVPITDLARIEPGMKRVKVGVEDRDRREVEVFSRDEEWLRGGFLGIEEKGATAELKLEHGSFRNGCGLMMAVLRSVVWEGGAEENPQATFPERLQVGVAWVRGRLVAANEALPRWLFDGAVEAVRLNPQSAAVIERDPKVIDGRYGDMVPGNAFLVLKSGEVMAARVDDLSRTGVKFLAPGVVPMTMAKAQVRGVLIPSGAIATKGFVDPGWRQLRGGNVILGEGERTEILLEPGHALGHPAMMEGDGVDFTLKEASSESEANGVAGLRLTLFARNLEASEKSLRLLVAFVGEEIYCGDEAGDGQMRHQGQVMKSGSEAKVQVRVYSDRALVRVNGIEVVNVPLEEGVKVGSGLILEPGELWGNSAQAIRVAGFEAKRSMDRGRVPQVEEEVRRQILTIPRSRANELPEQVLIASTGDLLRGSVESWSEDDMELRWGLDAWRVPRERVAAVVMLEKPGVEGEQAVAAAEAKRPHWLLMANGSRLGVTVMKWGADEVVGQHPLLGRVVVPAAGVRSFWMQKAPTETEAVRAMAGWQMKLAEAPQIAVASDGTSEQVGGEAKNFTLPLLDGGEFVLEKYRGKVVVLDFWASWCGPCLKALPELMEAMKGMPSDEVHLVGVNQGEPAAQVKGFLTTRRWNLTTVLDVDQAVGKQFGVKGIPHTVVIGPDGKVAMVKTGYSAAAAGEIAGKVREFLKGK